ncbi:MAG: hypothetical protein AAB534_01310 [Patescibacteria group bacterium]
MQFSFRSVPHHVTQKPQWQHRCFEGDVKTMYVPHWESPFKVTCEGRYEGNVVGQISKSGDVPRILTVMVTGEVKVVAPEVKAVPKVEAPAPQVAVAPKPPVVMEGRFKLEPYLASDNLQWKRRLKDVDGNTIAIHIVDERSAKKPQIETEDWQYSLAVRLSLPGEVPEIWRVETMQEIVSERALRRRKQASRRQALVQARIADLLKAQEERQKFGKELEIQRAGGGKNKQGKGKKSKQLAHAS